MSRIVTQHFENAAERLDKYFQHSGLADRSDVVGMAREGFVKLFLQGNLPSVVDYSTGQIIDHQDNRSGQIDLILQSAFSPRLQLFGDIHIAFSDYVICAIEVKSTITTAKDWESRSELRNILTAARTVKGLERRHYVEGMLQEQQKRIRLATPYCVFAYRGPTEETICAKIRDYERTHQLPLDAFVPDVITVLDRRYTLVRNNGWLYVAEEPVMFRRFTGRETLLNLFMYLTRTIEAWNMRSHGTDFRSYVLPHEQ
ncbi:MAG: hypothetical protein HQ592_13060 [Planctomycetes bacterium]|nr:hypothetical protein [Planctomycetota bacterium]